MKHDAVELDSVAPMLVVGDLGASVAFYRDALGFTLRLLVPEDDPFFAVLRRGPVALLLKEIGPDVPALPNPSRHKWARWDALVYVREVDALCAELITRGVELHEPLVDTDDGLRAFEVADPDGHVLCFAWPLDGEPA